MKKDDGLCPAHFFSSNGEVITRLVTPEQLQEMAIAKMKATEHVPWRSMSDDYDLKDKTRKHRT